jgi:hypothetical protein
LRVVAWLAWIGSVSRIGCAIHDWHAIVHRFDRCSLRNIVLWDGVVVCGRRYRGRES